MHPILHLLGLAFAVVLSASPAHVQSKAKVQTSAAATPERPDVELKIVPDRDGIELQQQLQLVVIVTNNSATPLKRAVLSMQSSTFAQTPAATSPEDIPAFGSRQWVITVRARETREMPAFGVHKAAMSVSYDWTSPTGTSMTSEQTDAVSLNLLRRFDEEGKSLPGGTAAFLYLILPLVPAFFAYDAVDRLRRGMALAMPTFGTEQIVPGFLLAFLLSIGFVTMRGLSVETAYTNRLAFFGFLAASAGLGALIPGLRWLYAIVIRGLWGFRTTDTAETYLRKALLSPYRPTDLVWIEGTAGGIAWKGMQLTQPDGALVLGARLQVSPSSDDVTLEEVRTALIDRRRIVALIKARKVNVLPLEKIVRGEGRIDELIVTEGLTQFQTTRSVSRPLAEVVQ